MNQYEEEKLLDLKEHMQILKPGDTISVSYIQRKVRVGYEMAKRLLQNIHEAELVESYQQWVGTTVNGVRTDGHEITLYRIPTIEKETIV